jgi:uncharacterized protein
MEALRVLQSDVEQRVAAIRREGWPCRKGCDGCCRSLSQPPVLTEPEWRQMAGHVTPAMAHRIRNSATDPRTCPLLGTDGLCGVYDVRPVACRTYGFYVDREGGLLCSLVQAFSASHEIVWGSAEAVERRLDAFGPRRSLLEWLLTDGR